TGDALRLGFVAAFIASMAIRPQRAQEMEPRAYSPSPVGTNFMAAVIGDTSGAILFDPSIPLTDVSASLRTAAIAYGRSFGLLGRQAVFTGAIPYVWGHVEGEVLEQQRRVRRSGFADVRLKLSLQILGPGVLTPEEFAKAPRRTVLGVSLTVQAP